MTAIRAAIAHLEGNAKVGCGPLPPVTTVAHLSTLLGQIIWSLPIFEERLRRGVVAELFGPVWSHLTDVRNQPSFKTLDDR